MELLIIWQMVLRRWWLMLIPVVVVAVVAVPDLLGNQQVASGGYRTLFQYSAAQETSNFDVREGDYQDVWLASEFVVNAFTDWVKTSSFRDELALVLDDDSINFGLLGIASDNDRSIGRIEMSYPEQEVLERIAAAAIEVLQTRNQQYFPHLGDQPAEVNIIDAPIVQPAPAQLTSQLTPLIQLGVAFVVGLGLAVLAEYLDPTLRDVHDVEAQGLVVLGQIPRQ